jgi:ATP-dependent helicase/nuclease subunit B
MPTTILQATVGAGKTESALHRLAQRLTEFSTPSDPLPKAWVLLATKRQEVAFRQRMIAYQNKSRTIFNVEFFNFYELNARILAMHHFPTRRIHEPARLGLIRTIAENLYETDQLQVFKHIWQTSGFVGMVADFIYELKQNLVEHEAFSWAARTQKDKELAQIYQEYQQALLRHRLVDREGEGWLALRQVQAPQSNVSQVRFLLVDGYDQFNVVQAQMLAYLSKHIGDTLITLTTVPGRTESIGRRFEKAYQVLQEAHDIADTPLELQQTQSHSEARTETLRVLAQNIFTDSPAQTPQANTLHFIEAPEPDQESSAVLRRIKGMLLDGISADELLIAVRDWERYGDALNHYAKRYGIPLLLHYQSSVIKNPALATLMNVLNLSDGQANPKRPNKGFRRRALLDVLRSPYVRVPNISPEQVTLLEQISAQYSVVGGRETWLKAIRAASSESRYEDTHETVSALLDSAQARALSQALIKFFDAITPPASAMLTEFVQWMEGLIGGDTSDDGELLPDEEQNTSLPYSLNMLSIIRESAQISTDLKALNDRDVIALNSLKMIMRGFLQIEVLLQSTLNEAPEPVTWDDFLSELNTALGAATEGARNPIRNGRVLATSASEARGLPHQHVFILGLSEGIFPAPIKEDALYLDSEREAFAQRGVFLEKQSERANDDGIFYELISLPTKTLTLSRPTVREGKFWNESHLWRMVRAVFDSHSSATYRLGTTVPLSEVTSADELLLSVADAFGDARLQDDVVTLWQYIQQQPDLSTLWQHVVDGRNIEVSRRTAAPFDEYSGVLKDPVSQQIVQAALHDQRQYSATQLNTMSKCGYYWFAQYLLKLEALEDPEEGVNAKQLGEINHRILELTYGHFLKNKLVIHPDHLSLALDKLEEASESVLKHAPNTYHFQAGALWENEKHALKKNLIRLLHEDFHEESPFNLQPGERTLYGLELEYGESEPLYIKVGDQQIRVRGRIDRVDKIGNHLFIFDYKLSKTPDNKDMQEGKNFQMMVYALALQQKLRQAKSALTVGGGGFWSLKQVALKAILNLPADQDQLDSASQKVAEHLEQLHEADFAVYANKLTDRNKCDMYCPFYQLCRLGVTHHFKRE